MLGRDGRLEPMPEAGLGQYPDLSQAPEPAPFAIQSAIAAVQAPVDGGAIVAVNRIGLLYLAVQDNQVLLRWIEGADPEFAGRSVAQAWLRDGKAMILLHRNEVFETQAARDPVARIISSTAAKAVALPGFITPDEVIDQEDNDLYGAPYALFPGESDSWLVQFRMVGQERTRTAFAAWNPGRNQLEPLERSKYEYALRPAPVAEAPYALRLAAEALGGSLILDAHMADGSHKTWRQGSADTILAVRAWVSDTLTLSLASDGRLVMVTATGVHETHIDMPVPHAYFRDLAMLDGYLIAVWEEDLFPDLGSSGLVIMDLSPHMSLGLKPGPG
jgi:hypothetical protein